MTSQKKTYFTHILMIVGLVLPALIPVGSWVLAQEELKHFSSSHSISTSDYGVESPAGMAYSPEADSFILWAAGNVLHVINSREETRGKLNLAQPVENPLGMAFEEQSNSLFILSAGNTELAKIGMGQSGLPEASRQSITRFNISSFDLQDAQGLTFDTTTGRLFMLDARRLQILIVSPHPAQGFDGVSAQANNRIRRLSVESLTQSQLRGIAFNPNNGHLYIGSPTERKIYELTESGERVSTYDVSDLYLENPATMLFAPSQDVTDAPTIMDLYILDSGQSPTQISASTMDQKSTSQMGKIIELSLQTPAALPSGTTLLPSTLVHTIDTSNASWSPSSPDPAGIDYWPLTGRLLIADSEVDEMPPYWMGKNVFQSTTSGTLAATCSTISFTGEPTGVAINPNNNHIFFSTDFNDRIFEVSLGPDGIYCTSDDMVTITDVATLYNVRDAEDVAYGNNTLFVAGGDNAEVYRIPLGANGVLGGGDDGAMAHFDTAALGFSDMESLGYNSDSNTLFLASPKPSEKYLGETTTSGTLLRAYDLSLMGSAGNIRSDVTYAPSSQNPAIKNIYIASRGVDNDDNKNENDGRIWEIRISPPVTPTPTSTPTLGPGFAHVNVYMGGILEEDYNVPPKSSVRPSYAGMNNGPVKVQSTNGIPIVASERVAYSPNGGTTWTSYSELMGLPSNQLTTSYTFPWYNNLDLNSQLRFGNVGTSNTTVTVTIGGIIRGSYNLAPNQSQRVSYAGLDKGPVKVTSFGGIPIIASMRVAYFDGSAWTSFSEMMGLPSNKLTNSYVFPWYNNLDLNSQLRFGNVGTANTTVTVTVGGVLQGVYDLAPNASTRVSYTSLDRGPVKVTSSGNVPIIASMRVAYFDGRAWTDFSEMMGLPIGSLSTHYSFPVYDNVNLNTQLRFGNMGNVSTTVTVTIGGVLKGTYTLLPNQSQRVSYIGLNSGPVVIKSSGGVPIIASERVAYFDGSDWTSFAEMMGLPQAQLTTTFIFPWYNNLDLNTQLRFGVP